MALHQTWILQGAQNCVVRDIFSQGSKVTGYKIDVFRCYNIVFNQTFKKKNHDFQNKNFKNRKRTIEFFNLKMYK